jgi:hypothetical protein
MFYLYSLKGPAAEATDAPQPWKLIVQPLWWSWRERWSFFFISPSNGAPVEWNWQGKTKVLGKKPVPVPLCPPQIPHGPTRDWTRTSAVRGWLTLWSVSQNSRHTAADFHSAPRVFQPPFGVTNALCLWSILLLFAGLWSLSLTRASVRNVHHRISFNDAVRKSDSCVAWLDDSE